MKRSILYLVISMLIISIIAFGDSTDLGSLCEKLLVQRAEAWNNILREDYDYDAFYNDMNSIASGKLLGEDLETFIYLKENPTDMEKVISLEFDERKIEKAGVNALIQGKVTWYLEGQEYIETIEGDYKIEMQRHKANWYIVNIEPIE